ncbi:hypothetical protein AGR7C_Lc120061 [Agrobacterium deltaense Zutra 3/1]|uniref:Uncharacterized protein n=1 Tax=Agrobacterium deltaense Zutra 3/1 TaxID=1183427 RepID=A0A1S7R2G4_9HYPH|nr:hypothetical protein AGR7C_Lc120061 [Agrobacterium deltaense Zutra 3/1]
MYAYRSSFCRPDYAAHECESTRGSTLKAPRLKCGQAKGSDEAAKFYRFRRVSAGRIEADYRGFVANAFS